MKSLIYLATASLAVAVPLIKRGLELATGPEPPSTSLDVGHSALTLQQLVLNINAYDVAGFQSELEHYQSIDYTSIDEIFMDQRIWSTLIIVLFALAMALLFPVMCIFVWCCRCCGYCGGSKPRKTGYPKWQVWYYSIAVVIMGALLMTGAGLVVTANGSLSQSLIHLRTGTSSLFTDFADMIEVAIESLDESTEDVADALYGFVDELVVVNYTSFIDPGFEETFSRLELLQEHIDNAQQIGDNCDELVNKLQDDHTAISSSLDAIRDQVEALKEVEFQGNLVTVVDPTPPDTSYYDSSLLPDMASIPDISSLLDDLSSLPNMTNLAMTARESLYELFGGLGSELNATSYENIGDPTALTVNMTTTFKDQGTSTKGIIEDNHVVIDTYIKSYGIEYDSWRRDMTYIQAGIIMGFVFISYVGVLLQKRKLILCLPPVIIIFALLVWLQFALYYLLAAPFNLVCTSRDSLLASSVAAPGDITIVPGIALDGCKSGDHIFNVKLNNANTTISEFLDIDIRKILNDLRGGEGGTFIEVDSVKGMINFTDVAPDATEFTSLNMTEFEFDSFTNLTNAVDFDAINASLDGYYNGLTYQTFDENYDVNTGDILVGEFNALVLQTNPTFVPWTMDDIINSYIIPADTFSYEDVTADNTDAVAIENKFSQIYPHATFRYEADNVITALRAAIIDIKNDIASLQSGPVADMTIHLDQLHGNVTDLKETIYDANSLALELTQSAVALNEAKDRTVDAMFEVISAIIDRGIDDLVVVVEGLFESFGKCDKIAVDIEYILDATCTNVTISLSVLWFGFLLIGVFTLPAVVYALKAHKRIGLYRKIGIAPNEQFSWGTKYGTSDRQGKAHELVWTRMTLPPIQRSAGMAAHER